MTPPDAEAQTVFLQKIQRIFSEGEFAATYKYALLLTLAELAVEAGDDSGAALDLPLTAVGEKFAELYWRQLATYQSGLPETMAAVLRQNQGAQAAVVNHLRDLHRLSAGRLSIARRMAGWAPAIRKVADTVRTMPLRYLQVVGGRLDLFLYDYPGPRGVVRLRPGVAFNLRRYQGLIQEFARSGWIRHVRANRLNLPMLGTADDLESFMFGSPRAPLAPVAEILAPIQAHRCFYCDGRLDTRSEVDHFIPWARYPRDTAHNFVLAHRGCNNDKRDFLAARRHLERWLRHLDGYGSEIGGLLAGLGFLADAGCSRQVARWAYGQAVESGSFGWTGRGMPPESLSTDCLAVFS